MPRTRRRLVHNAGCMYLLTRVHAHAMLHVIMERTMPIGYVAAMLAASEHQYIKASKDVKLGLRGNAGHERATRDYWWQTYRSMKLA